MKKRTITGLIMAAILIPLLTIPVLLETFQVVVIIGVIIAVFEMAKLFNSEKEKGFSFTFILLLVTLLVYFITAGFRLGTDEFDLSFSVGNNFTPIIMLVFLGVFIASIFIKNFKVNDIGKVFITAFFVGIGSASIVILRVMGVRFIVYLLLIASVTDIFAYIFGIKFGKHKMAPTISPKKSWEGAIAGAIIATIVAGSFGLFYGELFKGELFNINNHNTILAGISNLGSLSKVEQGFIIYPLAFFGSIVGQLGDLFASKLKRNYEAKDFGNIFPGHGGVLDRFDSAFFVAMFLVAIFILLSKILV
ncbi:MAG TPA: phosphatidate cytidylyltransferase [Acholeplasmataceae bacterium]|nr:phosphatidate cytidylyltransferase [Acholeplasmataceae bacterium]